jgi:ankyrin repeat protein
LAYAGPLPPLLAAVATGNKAMTQFLIDRGANVNFDGWKDGNTPLHLAAQKGFQAVVEVLLASHADVNARNKTGATPLFCAVWNRQLKIIPMLLAAGADANLKDNGGLTAMTSAVGRSPELVQALLAGGANPNAEDKDGRTLLSYAVDRGGARSSAAMLKLLLAAKADPNGGKVDAPLLTAIRQADLAAAELLLQAGASPNAKGPVNWEVVIDGRNYSGDSKPAISPMYYAVQAQLPMVQLLLKFKGDPNDSQTDGKALLFSALDKPEIVRALLDAGANANATKGTDNQPDLCISLLQWAAFKNYSNSVDLLLQHGANPDACNALGNSALHSAADSLADETVFAALLDHQANPNVRNHNGKTPLDLLQAALNDHNSFPVRLPSVAAKEALVHRLIDLMHQRGALDNLPDWDRITLGRPANNYSAMVFQKSTNDWNHFTLLEMLYWTEARASRSTYWAQAAFPDLAHITVIRPGRDGTTHQRIPVNLLDGATNVAVARDMALEFGDVVEVPEREHSLAEATTYLTYGQELAILNHLRDQAGEATLVVAGGPAVKLRLQPFFSQIGDVLAQDKAALAALTSNSDLAHVQVTRRNPETNKTDEWTVDCTHPASWPLDLWLRAGDVIAVPLKP